MNIREALGDDAVGVEGPSGSGGGAGWKLVLFFLFLEFVQPFQEKIRVHSDLGVRNIGRDD